jgi:hypothetical protein
LAPETEQGAAAHRVGVAGGQVVEAVELQITLSGYKVPREDLEGIAGKVDEAKSEGAPYEKKQVMKDNSNKMYY